MVEGGLTEAVSWDSRMAPLPGHPELRCVPLDDRLADQLIARTLDPEDPTVREMTHDLSRFSSREQLARWRGERRIVCLQDEAEGLRGVIWVTPKPMPPREDYLDPRLIRESGPDVTWAIRLYGPSRGHGTAAAFSEHVLPMLIPGHVGPPPVWYETKATNLAARALGKRLGFVVVSGEAGGTLVGARFARQALG